MAEWIIEVKDGKFPIGKWTELVRCKDCVFGCAYNEKWYMPRRDGWWCCREEKEVDTDDFCSRGARWKNEANRRRQTD